MSEGICGSNLYVKPVEVCSFAALNKLNLYSPNSLYQYDKNNIYSNTLTQAANDLNSNFRDKKNNDFLYKYNYNDKKDLCFPIRPDDKNSPYAINCVLATSSIYFTYNSKKKTCSPIPNLNLPEDFEYQHENDKTYIYHKNTSDPEGKYSFEKKPKKAYCENNWYDWIITPNYHFGNKYEKDSGIYSPQDVRRCYKPCLAGYMPYIDKNGSNICVKKEIANDGYYSNKLDYSPIALINLIGNNETTLKALYYLMFFYENQNLKNDKTINVNYRVKSEFDIDINNIKIENIGPFYNNYLNDDFNKAYNEIKETIKNNIINEPIFDINGGKYELIKHILTYKHPNFKEEDAAMITLRGLNENNVTTNKAILLHTWFIAYNYYLFIENTVFFDTIENNKSHYFNINNNLNYLLDKVDDSYKNKKNKYKERLANILYQAINVCYNNKTDFSKNLIRMTKDAFDDFNMDSKKNFRIAFFDHFFNKDAYKSKKFIVDDSNKTEKSAENTHIARYGKSLLENYRGFEITYYKENDHIKDISKSHIDSEISKKTEEEKKKISADDIKNSINEIINNFSFYKEETQEKINKNTCSDGQIYNSNNKKCEVCGTYCKIGKDNTCSTDKRCQELCPDICKKSVTKTKCGTTKQADQSEENSLEEKKEDSDLIDINISKTSNGIEDTFYTGVNIFFLILSFYLLFVFYDIFKETIAVVANFIIYYYKYIGNYIANFFSWNKYEVKHIMAEYKKEKLQEQFSKILEKTANLRNE